jgi:hypothetical protein
MPTDVIVSIQQIHRLPLHEQGHRAHSTNKKTGMLEHPKAFDQVGLLFDEPPGRAGLFFS